MQPLTSAERKYLRAQAHHLDPVIYIGKGGLTDAVVSATDGALEAHELIKVKFNDHKDEKKTLSAGLAARTGSELAGLIGNVAILYRQHPEPEKRVIHLERA